MRFLDNVLQDFIDRAPSAAQAAVYAAQRERSVGLGLMGLQDVFFQLRLPFDSEPARRLSERISEEIYFWALTTSCDIAAERGPHNSFKETRAANGELQFDAWGVTPTDPQRNIERHTTARATGPFVSRWTGRPLRA